MSTLDGRDVRRARVAVSALFLVNGALMANVLPRMPAIKAQLELSNAALGTAVAAMPLGGLLAGSMAGLLIVRYSSRRVTVVGGVAFGLLLGLIGLAPVWLALAASFLVLGMIDAVMDAAMNAHGIAVQRGYGRSIMHGFHVERPARPIRRRRRPLGLSAHRSPARSRRSARVPSGTRTSRAPRL